MKTSHNEHLNGMLQDASTPPQDCSCNSLFGAARKVPRLELLRRRDETEEKKIMSPIRYLLCKHGY